MDRYWVPGTCIGYEHTFLNALADFVMGVETRPAQPTSATRCRRRRSATRCRLADMRANVLLLNMGGIVAQYPTKLDFHYVSPHMGRDLFGEVLEEAHRRKIRVVGRFDFSARHGRPVFDAHPEWFFRKADGAPVIYNELTRFASTAATTASRR
jgi:hypothetical protein